MFRKRRRDWRDALDEDNQETAAVDMERGRRRARAPYQDHHNGNSSDARPVHTHDLRRRLDAPSSWSCASKTTDQDQEEEEEEHEDQDETTSPSVYGEIQQRVDQVGAQVAQAQRTVAELRALLLQAVASSSSSPSSSLSSSVSASFDPNGHYATVATASSAKARVRIDMLCS